MGIQRPWQVNDEMAAELPKCGEGETSSFIGLFFLFLEVIYLKKEIFFAWKQIL